MQRITRLIRAVAASVAAFLCPQARDWRAAGVELGPNGPACPHDKDSRRLFVLACDPADTAAIVRVIAERERDMPMPEGGSNRDGAVIAEICRGWSEMVDAAGPPPDPWKN